MTAKAGEKNSVRLGARVLYYHGPGANEVQFIDVGMNLDFSLRGQEDSLSVEAGIDRTWVGPEKKAPADTTSQPVVDSLRTQVSTPVTLGKATVIPGYDDLASGRRYEIEPVASRTK